MLFVSSFKKQLLLSVPVGFLISSTFHDVDQDYCYRETVSRVTNQGHLVSLLPGFGPGPREFFPLLLSGVWHVYMKDGHGGIMAVTL
jgi:hypothetical protein